MHRLTNTVQPYPWGSPTAIPELLGVEPSGAPVAELWMGAHPSAPSLIGFEGGTTGLDKSVAEDPVRMLGADVVARFGTNLPYLLKVIAADKPLSLQVHPGPEQAREGFAVEEASGKPVSDPTRNYKDPNHKPELVYALSTFEALCGFRAPRRAAELLSGLDAPLAVSLHGLLRAAPSAHGIRTAFRRLLEPGTRPEPDAVDEVARACRRRLEDGSPSRRADETVVLLAEAYPGDPGVVTSLLLNPVTLRPGEAMFVPAGGVHCYLHGCAVEAMASSDNVLRAGLTTKHVDIPELLDNVDYVAAPPIRIAPEVVHEATRVYYAPVDDFELSVTAVEDGTEHPLPGRGPRVLLCLDGSTTVSTVSAESGETLGLSHGESAFVPAADGALRVAGRGTLIQAAVP